MALARVKTWNPGDTLTAADQNAEFNNILNNALSLISPLSGTLAFSGTSPFSVANAQTLTVSIIAQTVGAATLSIPNFAGVADTFVFSTLLQTLNNKTLSAPTLSGTISGTYTLGGTLTISSTAAFTNASPFSVANAQTLTVSTTAQTIGAATLTIPNFAGVADTFAFITLAQTLANKTFSAPTFSGAYTLGGTPTFGTTMAGASTFSGAITFSAAGTALAVTNNAQIGSLGIGVAPSGTAGRLTVNENLIVSGVGSHAIGGATNSQEQLAVAGSFSERIGIHQTTTLTVPAGVEGQGIIVNPTLVEAGSGTHPGLYGLRVALVVTAGAATTTDAIGLKVDTFAAASGTTNASAIKIEGAPTGATNNYPLWVVGGIIRADSTTQTTVGAAGSASALPANPTGYLQINLGGTLRVIPFYAQS